MDGLTKKLKALLESAQEKLNQSAVAIENGEFDTVKSLQAEVEALQGQIDLVKNQIEQQDDIKSAVSEPDPKEQRLPFDVSDPEPKKDSPVKDVHILRYGETHKAVDVVIKDIFGSKNNYFEAKDAQHGALAKYIRYGDSRLTAKEHDVLDTLIFTPTQLLEAVKSGLNVAQMKYQKATLQESSLELGGHLVPEDFRLDVIKRLMGMTVIRGRARQITTTRDKVEWPRMEGGGSLYTSGVRVTWVEEIPSSATSAETNFTLGTVSVPVHTAMARTNISRNLLEDSGVNILEMVSEQFSEAMALDEDARFLSGTGGGVPRGILGKRTGATYDPDDGVSVVNSGNASLLTADGLIDLVYGLDAQYHGNAVLIGAKSTFAAIRKLKDGESNYLWARGLERGAPPVVLGYDYFMNEVLPTVAASAHPLIFGDLRGYLIADRIGMTIERVQDVTTVGQNYVALFARRRLGGQTIEPWRLSVQKVSA